jgi:hypothetical protein
MFVRYPPGTVRLEGDRPVALLGGRGAASSYRVVAWPLGCRRPRRAAAEAPGRCTRPARRSSLSIPTARSAARRPRWPPGRPRPPRRPGLAGSPDHSAPAHRRQHRPCWSPTAGGQDLGIPFRAYWLSGPDNHHVGLRRRRAGPFHTGPPHPPAMSGHATVAASPPGPVSSWAAGSHLPSAACFEPDGRHFSHGRRLRANSGCPRPWPRELRQYPTGKNLGDR